MNKILYSYTIRFIINNNNTVITQNIKAYDMSNVIEKFNDSMGNGENAYYEIISIEKMIKY